MKRERTYPFFAMRSKEDANGKSYMWQSMLVNLILRLVCCLAYIRDCDQYRI